MKKIMSYAFALAILLTLCGCNASPSLSPDDKDDKIAYAYVHEGYEAAVDLVSEYYGTSDESIKWRMALKAKEDEKIADDLDITEKSLESDGDGYYIFKATIKNNSLLTVDYFEVNIYLYDEDMSSLDTTYTNWSGKLRPGESAKVDKMIKYDEHIKKFRADITDVST